MVVVKSTKDISEVIDFILEWAKNVNENNVEEEDLIHEYVIKIRPMNIKSSRIEFRLSYYGKFDFGVGENLYWEDFDISKELIIDICESVKKGRVKEKMWTNSNGKVLKSEGQLELSNRKLSDRRNYTFFGKFKNCEVKKIYYQPFTYVKS